MLAPFKLEIGADTCSCVEGFTLTSGAVALLLLLESLVSDIARLGPLESISDDVVSPVKGPGVNRLPVKDREVSVWKICQVSEAEPRFLEKDDTSLELIR